MGRTELPAVVIAVAVLAVIVIGEVVVYTSDYTDYSADAGMSDDGLHYSVSADGSKTFSVVVSDNAGYLGVERLYLYYDPTYRSDYEAVDADVGAPAFDQEYYLEQVANLLEYRGVRDVSFVDAAGLASVMSEGISSGGCSGTGLVVVSGALPDTVYTGSGDDLAIEWIGAGGSLYWAGNQIGASYATHDDIVPVEGGEALFLGAECTYEGDDPKAYDDVAANEYTLALSLMNNDVRYGVNPAMVPSDRPCMGIGYEKDGYASIALVGLGDGMVCVFGGQLSNFQRYDMAQVIASGIGPGSEIVTVETGSVTRGTVEGVIADVPRTGVTVFIYLGGYYPVYADAFRF